MTKSSNRSVPSISLRSGRVWAAAVLCAAACLTWAGPADDPAARLGAEIDRLQQSLKGSPLNIADFPDIGKMIRGALTAAGESLHAGRLYVSLEQLGQATDLFDGARTYADEVAAMKGGLPAYEAEWDKTSAQLTALDHRTGQSDWADAPAAVRALSEAAQGRSMPLLEGGRGFAVATGPKDGLFYMGQAKGEAAFAAFCAALGARRQGTALPLRSMLPEIEALQAKTNAAFVPPRSVELHPRFIALNSTLKLAGELDAGKLYAGSLFEYLEAVRHYGLLDAAPLDAAAQAAAKDEIAAALHRLDSSPRDDSVARIFVERAQSQVAHADGSAPSADEWRSAQVIAEQVLPAYYDTLKPAAPLKQAAGKTATVTLVRWPYT